MGIMGLMEDANKKDTSVNIDASRSKLGFM